VADSSISDLQKIFEVRMLLEGFCARLAAQRVTTEQVAQMEAALEELERVPEGDIEALMSIDARLHELLYQSADNEFLADSLHRLHALSLRLWHLVLNRLSNVQEAVEQHREITNALKARDETRAEELVQQHIAHFQQEVKTVL
jgi:DNA-binding GntR family transcriptional regulator